MKDDKIFSPLRGNQLIGRPEWEEQASITIRETSGAINELAQKTLEIKHGDSVLMSRKDGELYICVLPIHSKLVGFVVKKYKQASSLRYRSLPLVKKFGIESGIYILTGEVLHDQARSIDWYKLTLLKE